MSDMPQRLPYTLRETTRHGKTVWYFRRGKGARIRLPGKHGDAEFMAAYNAALVAERPAKAPRAKPGSLEWLFTLYMASTDFADLAEITRKNRSAIMRSMTTKNPQAMVAGITPATIQRAFEKMHGKYGAANNWLKAMRGVFKWATAQQLVEIDPTAEIRLLPGSRTGYHTWTPAEIETYQARWPLGTRERLAMDLLVYTGVRRERAVMLGRQHVSGNILSVPAHKNGEAVFLPILPALQESIEATPSGGLFFLVTTYGQPYTAAGFGNWFRDCCIAAGVPGRAHGLRKAAATIAAEQGATTTELMALFGWKTIQEAERYTRAADRKRIAIQAAAKLIREQNETAMPRTTKPRRPAPSAK